MTMTTATATIAPSPITMTRPPRRLVANYRMPVSGSGDLAQGCPGYSKWVNLRGDSSPRKGPLSGQLTKAKEAGHDHRDRVRLADLRAGGRGHPAQGAHHVRHGRDLRCDRAVHHERRRDPVRRAIGVRVVDHRVRRVPDPVRGRHRPAWRDVPR